MSSGPAPGSDSTGDRRGGSHRSTVRAPRSAVQTAANTVRDLQVSEVVRQDVVIENGQVSGFRVRLGISFKYESGD